VSLPGRRALTHRGQPLTWQGTLEIAYGELGLKPWELDEYTMEDFVIATQGARKEKEEPWQQTRALAFIMAKPYLKNKNLTMEQFWPMPGDKGYGKNTTKARGKRISQMTPEERTAWAKQMEKELEAIQKADDEKKANKVKPVEKKKRVSKTTTTNKRKK
jgi:hypothetical protein